MNIIKKYYFLFVFFNVFSQIDDNLINISKVAETEKIEDPLIITTDDLKIEQSLDGGYYLYIKKKPYTESVMITESTEDPEYSNASYALRSMKFYEENGDEKRILDGEFLNTKSSKYALIDSTAEMYKGFGEAFRIFIPYIIYYGYNWTRHGEIEVRDGTYMNIKTFNKKYQDYSGRYKDNPFILRIEEEQVLKEEEEDGKSFIKEAEDKYQCLANSTDGVLVKTEKNDTMVDAITNIINENNKEDDEILEVVLVIDTTSSMKSEFEYLKEHFIDGIIDKLDKKPPFIKIGIVFYKDYKEKYLYKTYPLSPDIEKIKELLNKEIINGGRDIPEASYEALNAAFVKMKWTSNNRSIILITDAPPHMKRRGSVTSGMVVDKSQKTFTPINVILLPADKK